MDCKYIQSELSAYLDREVSLSKRKMIKEHLARCKNCELKYRELKSAIENLSFHPELEPSKDFTAKVMREIEEEDIVFEDWLSKLLGAYKPVVAIISLFSLLGVISLMTIVNSLPVFTMGKVFYHLFSSSYFVSDKLVEVYPEFKIFLHSALLISLLSFIFMLQQVKQWNDSK